MTITREASNEPSQLMPEDFWSYAVSLYSASGIKQACLHFQEAHGADVNMLLLCNWLDGQKLILPPSAFNELQTASKHWQNNVLTPFRKRRITAKKQSSEYTVLLEQELSIERKEQIALLGIINKSAESLTKSQHVNQVNLKAYALKLGLPHSAQKDLMAVFSSAS